MDPDNEQSAPGLSLQDYLAILRRRRAIILQSLVVITLVGVAYAIMTRPVYQATAELLVESPSISLNTVDASNPLSEVLQLSQPQTVDTQVEVLQAQPLMSLVAKQAGEANLTVAAVKDTNIIQVTGESHSAKAAASAPNTLLQLYMDQDVNQSLNEIRSAEAFAQGQEASAQRSLTAANAALSAFQTRNHIADLSTNRQALDTEMGALTDEVRKDASDLGGLRAQLAADQALLRKVPATEMTRLPAINPQRAPLETQIAALQVQRAALLQPGGYTVAAPQVKAIQAQIDELNKQLAAQPTLSYSDTWTVDAARQDLQGKMTDLQSQIQALTVQANQARTALTQVRAQVAHYAQWSPVVERLQQAHDAALAQENGLQSEINLLQMREKAHHATARILQPASVPEVPVRPKKAETILFAGLMGLFLGVCLALLQEFLDDRINTVEEAGRVLALPALGYVPALSQTDAKLLPRMAKLDPAAESYRVLRSNIGFVTVDAPARTLLVTSANPAEGKTTTAANLAFAMALDGKRVILVDTDLRRPSLHKLLEVPPMPGLTDVLLGHATLAETLRPQSDLPNLSILTSGSTPPNPGELLGSRRFHSLTEELKSLADVVILDSPPVLVAADAPILASGVDGVVFVVEAGATKKAGARHALSLLRQARANILGVAYNRMSGSGGGYYYYYNYRYAIGPLPGEASGDGNGLDDKSMLESPAALLEEGDGKTDATTKS